VTRTRPLFPWVLLGFWLCRALLLGALTALIIFLVQIAVCGIMHDNENVKAFLSFLRLMPGIVTKALGGRVTLQVDNITGLLSIGYRDPLVLLLFMLFAVSVPTGLLAGQVQYGTMELILSRSVTKSQVYICAGLVTLLGMAGLAGAMFLGTVAGTHLYDFDQPVLLQPFLRAAVVAALAAGAVGAIALMAAAAFRRQATAVGVTAAFLVVNYVVGLIAPWWPWMQPAAPFTLFHYIRLDRVFEAGPWPGGDMAVLGIVFLVSAVSGGIIWQRRDLPL
jgi:ABC-2 type transport system permease protein